MTCRVPVAKRNFRLRHNHGDDADTFPANNSQKVPSTICVAADQQSADQISALEPPKTQNNKDPSASDPLRYKRETSRFGVSTELNPMVDGPAYVSYEKMPKKRKQSHKDGSSKKRQMHEKSACTKYSDSIPSTIQISSDKNMPAMRPEQPPSSVAHMPRDESDKKMAAKGVSQPSLLGSAPSSKKHKKQSMKQREHGERHRDSKKKSTISKSRGHTDDASQLVPTGPDQVVAYPAAVQAPIIFHDTNQKPSANADSFKDAAGLVSASGGSTSVRPNNNRSMMNDTALVDRDFKNSDSRPAAAKPSGDNNDDEHTKKRILVWAGLLGERPSPKDDDSMAKWLMNVLAVSDPKAPFKGEVASSVEDSSVSFDGDAPVPKREKRRSDGKTNNSRSHSKQLNEDKSDMSSP